jgi:hypothetical protein
MEFPHHWSDAIELTGTCLKCLRITVAMSYVVVGLVSLVNYQAYHSDFLLV